MVWYHFCMCQAYCGHRGTLYSQSLEEVTLCKNKSRQFELTETFCQCALEMNADHPQALEMCANLLLERGGVEKAQDCPRRAVTVQPEQATIVATLSSALSTT